MDMVKRSCAIALALTAATCGSESASVDTGEPVRVTLETVTPPTLVGFRLESSADWQMLDPAGKSSFEFQVTGPYRTVVECDNSAVGNLVSAPPGVGRYARCALARVILRIG